MGSHIFSRHAGPGDGAPVPLHLGQLLHDLKDALLGIELVNQELDSRKKLWASDFDEEKNYKTFTGYKAVINEVWNDYLFLNIKNGKTVGRYEQAF